MATFGLFVTLQRIADVSKQPFRIVFVLIAQMGRNVGAAFLLTAVRPHKPLLFGCEVGYIAKVTNLRMCEFENFSGNLKSSQIRRAENMA